ncbi:MAG: methylated-DNA--[protein]-cysteine S-methyltransferase [Raoultibacter sp.]
MTLVYTKEVASPVGTITLASDGQALVGLWIFGQKYFARTIEACEEASLPLFESVTRWLDAYFAGKNPAIDFPLAPVGITPFRQGVWRILQRIPYGQVITYGEIAREMAQLRGREKMSAQAVGGAVGHNPISIIIPCHRVVGAGGSLTGYAGGIGIKKQLLRLEGVDMSRLYTPTKGTAL